MTNIRLIAAIENAVDEYCYAKITLKDEYKTQLAMEVVKQHVKDATVKDLMDCMHETKSDLIDALKQILS